MSRRARVFAPFALASAVVLGLSGCSVLEDWGVLNSAESTAEDAATTDDATTTEVTETTPDATGEEAEAEVV
jgi:hypothetical protein